jgi:broad specificity phosphatase PhoE
MGCAGTKIDYRYKYYSKSKTGTFIYLCHGETAYSSNIETMEQEYQVMNSSKYLDLGLGEIIQQDYNLLLNTNIKLIITSPMTRCLQTAKYILQDHPRKDFIRIVVHPYLIDIINGSYNIPCNIKKNMDCFNKSSDVLYDWSEFEKLYPNPDSQELFYLEFIDNYTTTEKDIIKFINSLKCEFSYDVLLELMGKFRNKNKLPESMKSVFKRVQNFKKWLQYYSKAILTNKKDKIVVISHPYFINLSCLDNNTEVENLEIANLNEVRIKSLDFLSINVE